jgi:hypothetical protein
MPYTQGAHIDRFSAWLKSYCEVYEFERGVSITPQQGAPARLDEVYGRYLVNEVKPWLKDTGIDEKLADRHKIASTMEAAIIFTQPFDFGNEMWNRYINAGFALHVATSVIVGWKNAAPYHMVDCASFYEQHLIWLRKVNQKKFPILSNAASWHLVERHSLLCEELEAYRKGAIDAGSVRSGAIVSAVSEND